MPDQKNFKWPNNSKGAVSLTYDDALPCHYNEVAPELEKNGLRGTFNLPLHSVREFEAWKELSQKGHEAKAVDVLAGPGR